MITIATIECRKANNYELSLFIWQYVSEILNQHETIEKLVNFPLK